MNKGWLRWSRSRRRIHDSNMAAATSVVVLDRGNNTTCTINLHGVCARADYLQTIRSASWQSSFIKILLTLRVKGQHRCIHTHGHTHIYAHVYTCTYIWRIIFISKGNVPHHRKVSLKKDLEKTMMPRRKSLNKYIP